jgi:hypothetical protein
MLSTQSTVASSFLPSTTLLSYVPFGEWYSLLMPQLLPYYSKDVVARQFRLPMEFVKAILSVLSSSVFTSKTYWPPSQRKQEPYRIHSSTTCI